MKLYHNSNTNNYTHINPYRIKRTYNTMLEQDKGIPTPSTINSKRLKPNEGKPAESLIKSNKVKIPEKLRREIELYNYERRGYNFKIKPCDCENQ